MKYALIKQDVYQDLYVCSHKERDVKNILFSSIMRVGPFGLIKDLNADFYIIKEDERFKETQLYRKSLPKFANNLHILKIKTANNLPGLEFLKPGSNYPNGKFSLAFDQVNWGKYDIVISINCALPRVELKKHPNTLFCYMIGEANIKSIFPKFGYDVTLTQESSSKINRCRNVGFPYTFLNSSTLEEVIDPPKVKSGIYIEINSHPERPVSKIPEPFERIIEKTGEKIYFHNQDLKQNLENISKAKYFVKFGGRRIRGNSFIESVSLGTLVLANKKDAIHNDVIFGKLNVESEKDIINTINFFNDNPEEYSQNLKLQKDIVHSKYYKIPIQSLEYHLQKKRKKPL
jgi:hypothetical protein